MVRKIQLDTVSLYRGGPAFTAIAVGHRCNFYSKIYIITDIVFTAKYT